MFTYLFCIVLLLLLSAFFSAAETAYSSANRNRLKSMAEKGRFLARQALKLQEDFDQLLSTILVGNNIVNIAAASACSVMSYKYLAELGPTIPAAILTLEILFFGEITPKSLAREYPERVALVTALPLLCLRFLLWPVNQIFTLWKQLLSRTFQLNKTSHLSQEELLMMVDDAQQEGGIDKDEGVLLRNAIKFTECRVEEILTHRVDIAALPLQATREEVAAKFIETKYSRLVIYNGDLDHIAGIVVLKDFFASLHSNHWNLTAIMTPPVLIQKTEKIDDVLKYLQQNCAQIAIVLDEFGGTLGMVSVEDIMEELVGEIWDEHDEVEEKFKQTGENSYRIDGTVSLDDFQEFFQLNLESKETLLSGWVLENLPKLPQKGDHFTWHNLEITIAACSSHRIRKVDVVRSTLESESAPSEVSAAE